MVESAESARDRDDGAGTWDRDALVELVRAAGDLALEMQRGVGWQVKPDSSIVTEADRRVEQMIVDALERPSEGVYLIGEETVAQKGEDYLDAAMRGEAFVVDPIDGTVPYAHQLPNWGVSVGRMVGGRIVDGIVYLPAYGEILVSDGDDVLEGRRDGDGWRWRTIGEPTPDADGRRPVGVTQELVKYGRVDLPNPVMVLGAAVAPLVGLVQGRFAGYLGSVRLWDIAGSLALILRKGFAVSVWPDGERREVTGEVSARTYDLTPGSDQRWKLLTDLLIAHPHDEARFRRAFVLNR